LLPKTTGKVKVRFFWTFSRFPENSRKSTPHFWSQSGLFLEFQGKKKKKCKKKKKLFKLKNFLDFFWRSPDKN
jgi:hypothetical protein